MQDPFFLYRFTILDIGSERHNTLHKAGFLVISVLTVFLTFGTFTFCSLFVKVVLSAWSKAPDS